MNEIQEKFELWLEANRLYNSDNPEDEPIMSDVEFDELTEELLSDGTDEMKKTIHSAINRGDELSINHEISEMISLFKIKYKSRADIVLINKFFNYLKKVYYYGVKLDGVSIQINWDLVNKVPTLIKTRGGLDVTKKLKSMPSIQKTLICNCPIVNGELVIKKSIFKEKYSDEFENPRNFVGGVVKRDIIEQSILNDLEFIGCTDGKNPLINENYTDYYWLWKKVKPETYSNLEAIISNYKNDGFPYPCDGLVIAYFEDGERQIKDKYPLNMVSIKTQGARVETKVTGFEWTQKKSGKLTPMVLVEHKQLDGITITKANGYNYAMIKQKGIGIGSIVHIEKSNDIIPVVAKVITRSSKITMPECGYTIQGKHLIASNLYISKKYKFILGLKTLNIDGIGDALSEKIGDILSYNIIELFNPNNKLAIYEILGGGKNYQKFTELYNIKNIYLNKVIELLQFDNVGPKIATKVALIITKKSNDTTNIPYDVLSNVAKGEGFIKIKEAINNLTNLGIKVLPPIEIDDTTITFEMTIDNKVSCNYSKESFIKRLKEKYPNCLHTALTKQTKYLFTNNLNSNTSKMNKARKYNVKIMLFDDALNIDKL